MKSVWSIIALNALITATLGQEEVAIPTCSLMPCPDYYEPICGSDGNTYSNSCEFKNAACRNPKLTVIIKGECPSECATFCPDIYEPVCGSDGVTYANLCFFKVAACKNRELTLANRGECPAQCEWGCPDIYEPLCGSDGITYGNACEFKKAACKNPDLKVVNEGECRTKPPVDSCDRICTREYYPLCGSDGVTYSNKCTFQIAVCKNPKLTLAYEGECRTKPPVDACDFHCPKDDICIVCGSDGVTYMSKCEFMQAQCKNPALQIVSAGVCPTKPPVDTCDRICTKEYFPLCGSDGVTYANKCMFEIAMCKNPKLSLAYEGECKTKPPIDECKNRICTLEYAPVCASNGVTYGNTCAFEWAVKCDDPNLKIVSKGPCPTKPPVTRTPLPTLTKFPTIRPTLLPWDTIKPILVDAAE